MYQPGGFNDQSGRVCKLQKSLYGLTQAPKNWNKKFSDFLKSLGLVSPDDDPCVYYNKDRSIIIVLHVDDGLMVGKNKNTMVKILRKLNEKFQITYDVGEENILSYLGMQIEIKQTEIFVNQSKYAKRILERFKFDDCYPVYTPIERGMVTEPEKFMNDTPLEE